jgi:hypothetical protein
MWGLMELGTWPCGDSGPLGEAEVSTEVQVNRWFYSREIPPRASGAGAKFCPLTGFSDPHTVSGSRTAPTGGHKLFTGCDLRFCVACRSGYPKTDNGGIAGRSPLGAAGVLVLPRISGMGRSRTPVPALANIPRPGGRRAQAHIRERRAFPP